MKNKRKLVKRKLMAGLVAGSFLLSACSSVKQPPETRVIIQTVIVTPTPTPTEATTTTTRETTTEATTTTTEATTTTEEEEEEEIEETEEETTTKETKNTTSGTRETNKYGHEVGSYDDKLDSIFDKFNKINEKIDSIDYQKIKDTTKKYAKSLIDFIFYGGTIGGKTFDELKSDVKEETYSKLQKIDSYIMKFEPNYKEKLGQKYNLVKDFSKTTLKKAKEVFNSHIQININPTTKAKTKKKTLKNTKKKSK